MAVNSLIATNVVLSSAKAYINDNTVTAIDADGAGGNASGNIDLDALNISTITPETPARPRPVTPGSASCWPSIPSAGCPRTPCSTPLKPLLATRRSLPRSAEKTRRWSRRSSRIRSSRPTGPSPSPRDSQDELFDLASLTELPSSMTPARRTKMTRRRCWTMKLRSTRRRTPFSCRS